jgi:hypothetical protein
MLSLVAVEQEGHDPNQPAARVHFWTPTPNHASSATLLADASANTANPAAAAAVLMVPAALTTVATAADA